MNYIYIQRAQYAQRGALSSTPPARASEATRSRTLSARCPRSPGPIDELLEEVFAAAVGPVDELRVEVFAAPVQAFNGRLGRLVPLIRRCGPVIVVVGLLQGACVNMPVPLCSPALALLSTRPATEVSPSTPRACRRRPCSSVASWSSRASWRPCW